jgi:hypothetical protein
MVWKIWPKELTNLLSEIATRSPGSLTKTKIGMAKRANITEARRKRSATGTSRRKIVSPTAMVPK